MINATANLSVANPVEPEKYEEASYDFHNDTHFTIDFSGVSLALSYTDTHRLYVDLANLFEQIAEMELAQDEASL